ncbi:PhzF family phenazine biosynthesis protein [Cesiribacter andamanensis]|uniref:Putative isomerase yddE n=1 Tax=Cesiribacter andamanensis AMV16 TaxID=1279009 RepID=M7N1H7_9BACT|nr:PhzF family phenazine biosynthesis isomerase [Cesiribacter andamanensis]EMR02538.1 putative isomerase yddE [Cesiribacter andamanensis AMV16]
MELFQVDSFTHVPFRGNPAGVCLSAQPLSELLMQQIAAEMNLSETAFVHAEDGYRRLRWFTPAVEVTLCGHATLAAAHVLFSQGLIAPDAWHVFDTLSGQLQVRQPMEGVLEMDFPLITTQSKEAPQWLQEHFEGIQGYACTEKNDILELASEQAVRDYLPDMEQIARNTRQGLIITARGEGDIDFVSRYFVPNVGVPEDPVTGRPIVSWHITGGIGWKNQLSGVPGLQTRRAAGAADHRSQGTDPGPGPDDL